MNIITRVSNKIKMFANKRYIIPVLILFVLTLIMMQKSPIGAQRLGVLSGGLGMLDMQFGYTAETAYAMLEQIGAMGRILYSKLLCLDFLFILVYTALQTLLITALMRKANITERWHKMNLLPFLRSMLDIAENILLLSVITNYPEKFALVVSIASAITAVKLMINYGYIAIVFLIGAWTTRQSILSKMTKEKFKESRQMS